MKIIPLLTIALLTFNLAITSQNDTIELALNKMTVLAFDDKPIFQIGNEKHFIVESFGSKLMVQPRFKNAVDFKETNLFIQIGEVMRMFVIVYKMNPKTFIYDFQTTSIQTTVVPNVTDNTSVVLDKKKLIEDIKKDKENEEKESFFSTNCSIAQEQKQDLFNKGVISKKMKVVATNFYVDRDFFYLKLVLNNSSKIDYDIKYIDFNIKNREQLTNLKEDAYQFDKVNIVYKDKEVTKVKGKEKESIIFVFDKFTIGKHKKFTAKIRETNGDRIFDVDFFSDDIANIKQLED